MGPESRLWELLERRVDATPDALMLVDDDMRTLTFAEFWAEAERAAAGLDDAGVGSDAVVSWSLPNWIETFVLMAALARLDVLQHPVGFGADGSDIEQLVARAGSDLLVVPPRWNGRDLEAEATGIARGFGGMRVLVADRALPQGDPSVLTPLHEYLDARDRPVRWCLHTPDRAGESRLVGHSDATLYAAANALVSRLGLIPQDRVAFAAPATGADGIAWFFAGLISGCAGIVTDRSGDEACEVLAREGVTVAGWSVEQLRSYPAYQRRQLHPAFPDLRAFAAGSAVQDALRDELDSLFEVPVLAAYGSTEAPLLAIASISDPPERSRSGVGIPSPGVEIRVVPLDGPVAVAPLDGELRVRAPQMMAGYLDPEPDPAGDPFDRDGYFRTGDVGTVDEHGVVSISARLDELDRPGMLLPDESTG